MDSGNMITIKQVAKMTDVSESYIRRLCRRGDIPGALKISARLWIIDKDNIPENIGKGKAKEIA